MATTGVCLRTRGATLSALAVALGFLVSCGGQRPAQLIPPPLPHQADCPSKTIDAEGTSDDQQAQCLLVHALSDANSYWDERGTYDYFNPKEAARINPAIRWNNGVGGAVTGEVTISQTTSGNVIMETLSNSGRTFCIHGRDGEPEAYLTDEGPGEMVECIRPAE